eukprot:377374_1
MGNSAPTNHSNNFGELKFEKYPLHIAEEEWKAADFWNKSNQSKEVILSSNGDQRVRAVPDDYYEGKDDSKHAIYNIVRLKIKYSAHCHGLGTGVIIHHTLNKSYVLTAAHNIVGVDEHNTKIVEYPEAIWIEMNENTSKGYKTQKRYHCNNYHIHSAYIKYLQDTSVKESATGYDIAIIEVLDPDNELKTIRPVKLRLFQSAVRDNLQIKVIGYPGELAIRGQLYGMKGVGKINYINDQIKHNKLIIYDNIDTSDGQSGSPIFECCDDDKNDDEKNEHNIYKTFGRIVGVHVAGKKKKKLNYGTMINNNMLQWIHKCIDGDCTK